MFKARDKTQIIQAAINDLAAQSAIANLSPGSKARAIVEAMGNVIGSTAKDLSIGLISTLLPNAQGPILDLLADTVGLQRLPEIRASIDASDLNLRYFVRTGTFGDVNNGQPISVPAGTEIKTASDRGRGDAIMIQRSAVVLPAGGSEVFFAADQIGSVLTRGIAANALNRHNFTGYSDSAFLSLLVSNNKGVAGRPLESDQNLRFRTSNHMTSTAEANQTAIRLNTLLVPGVSDIRIVPNRSGLGTFDVIVFGISPIVSDNVISSVQRQINTHQAAGMRGIAVAPRIVGLSLTTRVAFRDDATEGDKNSAANAARSAVREYILSQNAGQLFVINSLVRVILDSHPKIRDVGDPNNPFDEILIWRQTSTGDSRFSRNLTENFLIAVDEELIAEPFITQPIRIIEV